MWKLASSMQNQTSVMTVKAVIVDPFRIDDCPSRCPRVMPIETSIDFDFRCCRVRIAGCLTIVGSRWHTLRYVVEPEFPFIVPRPSFVMYSPSHGTHRDAYPVFPSLRAPELQSLSAAV